MTKGETQCAEEEDIWDLLIVKIPRQLQKWGSLLDYRSRTHKPSQELEIQIWEQKAYNMVFQTFPESDHVPLQTLYRGSAEEKQAAWQGRLLCNRWGKSSSQAELMLALGDQMLQFFPALASFHMLAPGRSWCKNKCEVYKDLPWIFGEYQFNLSHFTSVYHFLPFWASPVILEVQHVCCWVGPQ